MLRMKLTKEQHDAFARAKVVCSVIKRGHAQYAVRHPWRDIGGPSTETVASWGYIAARQECARAIAWHAMRALGHVASDCEYFTADRTGPALDIFKAALLAAGPVSK